MTEPSAAPAVPADGRPRGEIWTERTVAWYERANARSDYAARVLGAIEPLLAGCRSALDVGAGFGALALPLARRLEQVTVLEPSPAMAAALRQAVGRAGLANVTVVDAAWGAAPVEPHDLVVCAHVGPLLQRGAPFLAEVGRWAARGVVLVRDAPHGEDKFFFSALYPLCLGRPYERGGGDAETLTALADLGIAADVTWIDYRSDQPFESFDEACEFWMCYLGLTDPGARRTLRGFLAGRLRRDGTGWLAPYRKRAAVMQWRTRGPAL